MKTAWTEKNALIMDQKVLKRELPQNNPKLQNNFI
jgi:hypothetical protein